MWGRWRVLLLVACLASLPTISSTTWHDVMLDSCGSDVDLLFREFLGLRRNADAFFYMIVVVTVDGLVKRYECVYGSFLGVLVADILGVPDSHKGFSLLVFFGGLPSLISSPLADKQTQTDDDYLADLEQKHEMELAKLESNIASHNERTKQLQQLTDKLNAEANNMKLMLAEKDQTCQVALETINRLQTSLIGFRTEGCVHLLKTGVVDRRMVLNCLHLKLEKDRVNLAEVHINTEGDLVNRKSDTRPAGDGRLKNYSGTCSTAPLPRAGCPQYWEMESRVSLDKTLTWYKHILEVAVCKEEQRDRNWLDGSPGSYSMTVSHCPTHGGICRMISKEWKCVLLQPDTLPITAGASHTLHYGIVYEDARKKIVFIDVKENKVISTLKNVDSSQPLWPMFGVNNQHLLNISMTLVVGSDINMTEEKKGMIVKALSSW